MGDADVEALSFHDYNEATVAVSKPIKSNATQKEIVRQLGERKFFLT